LFYLGEPTPPRTTIGAVAKGDLGQPMELQVDGRPLKGEFLRCAKRVNTMREGPSAWRQRS